MTGRAPALHWLVALGCYSLALVGSAALGLVLFLLGLDLWQPRSRTSLPVAWLVNVGWLVLFGVQHSGMARSAYSGWWQRHFVPCLERAFYVGVSGLVLLGMTATWQPLPGHELWRGPWWLSLVALAGAAGLAVVNLRHDHLGLFGLRQVHEAGREPLPEVLLTRGPYRLVRHPLMSCLLVLLWGHAVMTPTLALLSGGLSLYIALGTFLEERDLVRRFGDAYTAYRRQVPALVPWRLWGGPGR